MGEIFEYAIWSLGGVVSVVIFGVLVYVAGRLFTMGVLKTLSLMKGEVVTNGNKEKRQG